MDYKFVISSIPPSLNEVRDFISSSNSGAIFIFNGKVRNKNNEKSVEYLEYEIDSDTGRKLFEEEIKKYKKNIEKLFVFQAEGKLKVGENTIIIGASSYGRKEAINCVLELLEFLKHRFPVWKKEYYKDSSFKRL